MTLDQRLPENPQVVAGVDGIGKYGGTWRMGMTAGTDDVSFYRIVGYESLVRWNPEWTDIVPDAAEKWDASADAKEYTFYLRKGMKWSDGQPFTADDILFWWEDVELNTELTAAPPSWMVAGDEPGKVIKVDDYTIKFTFAQPNGLFLSKLAGPDSRAILACPKHFAQQYHAKYQDKAKLEQMMKDGGYTTWRDMFIAQVTQSDGGGYGQYSVAGRPTMYAWMVEQPISGSATQVVFVRNPYYWKVDPEGQQYPYVDRLVYTIFQDTAAMLLKATNGEIDFQMRHFNSLANKAVLYDNMTKGNYKFFDLVAANSNTIVYHLNLTHKNPTLRAIFQNKDFRIGLSYAINRQEIIDTVYMGQGEPAQPAPVPGNPLYNEQLAKQYTEYDVAKANEYLDKVLPKKDANGMRLLPDGKPFSFVIEISNSFKEQVDAGNMVAKYWQAVGVNAQAKPEDRSLMYQRKNMNDLDAMTWGGEAGMGTILDPRNFFPYSNEAAWGVAWANWYNGGRDANAEEPPAEIKKMMDLYDQAKATASVEGQNKIMAELLQLAADYFPCIGISTAPMSYGIVKNTMGNAPKKLVNSWPYPTPAPANMFTLFFK
jgi:peptide/nickel transport system substrate-binding protein